MSQNRAVVEKKKGYCPSSFLVPVIFKAMLTSLRSPVELHVTENDIRDLNGGAGDAGGERSNGGARGGEVKEEVLMAVEEVKAAVELLATMLEMLVVVEDMLTRERQTWRRWMT